MRRRARTRLAGTALALAVTSGLTACTGMSGDGGIDTKPGDASAATEPAPPGKFRTLPEPCGAVNRGTLEKMLPGAAAQAKEHEKENDDVLPSATPSPLQGEAALTYDTDRRVGCTWQSTTSLGSRQLTVDFERIVSYDPEVSDDQHAAKLFSERAEEAGIAEPDDDTSTEPGTDDDPSGAEAMTGERHERRTASRTSESSKPAADDASTQPSPSDDDEPPLASPSPSPPSLPPRTLDDIGETAYIDDRLRSTANGRGSRRDVSLVFRTSNVLVTVEYRQSISDAHRTPDSRELQKHAEALARQLAERFSDT